MPVSRTEPCPARRRLAAQILQRHPDQEGIAPDRVPGGLIVAAPRHAKLDTFVVVKNPKAMANRVQSIRDRKRVLAPVGEVDHRRSEDRPIAGEAEAAAEPDFLAVAQILDRRIDIAVQAEIADARIGLPATEGGVDLVATKREALLVDAEAVDQAEPSADAQVGAADEIGKAPRQSGALRQDAFAGAEAIALADIGPERDAPEVDRPVGAIGDADAVLPAV